MTAQERMWCGRCIQYVVQRFQWIESMQVRVDGPVVVVWIAHSYPVDVRRELRECLRAFASTSQIELTVETVPVGYGAAERGAEQIAAAGTCPAHVKRPELWN